VGGAPRRRFLGLDLCEHVDALPAIVAYLVGDPTRDPTTTRSRIASTSALVGTG
jgi:hypothetical protein